MLGKEGGGISRYIFKCWNICMCVSLKKYGKKKMGKGRRRLPLWNNTAGRGGGGLYGIIVEQKTNRRLKQDE